MTAVQLQTAPALSWMPVSLALKSSGLAQFSRKSSMTLKWWPSLLTVAHLRSSYWVLLIMTFKDAPHPQKMQPSLITFKWSLLRVLTSCSAQIFSLHMNNGGLSLFSEMSGSGPKSPGPKSCQFMIASQWSKLWQDWGTNLELKIYF